MKILGIIAEYNPMHNGHIYHIKKAKELVKPDYTIVILSGSFTQQGNISVFDKYTKASLAIKYGADIVLELPTIYSISSANDFSYGAAKILNDLKITHLAFGAECENIEKLKSIADKLLKNKEKIDENFNTITDKTTYAKNYAMALKEFLNKDELELLTQSNNILAVLYLKSLFNLNSQIKPVLVHRVNVAHVDEEMPLNSKYASATAIRKKILEKDFNSIKNVVPLDVYNLLKNNFVLNNEYIFDMLKYSILKLGKEELANVKDVSEGLNNRLYDKVLISNSYEEFLSNVKTKRYVLGRIKRICINILLDITNKENEILKDVSYARVVKMKKDKKDLLKILNVNSTIPVIVKFTDQGICKYSKKIQASLMLDKLASDIYNILNKDNTINDYINRIDK